jgi:hypothetical protein
MGCPGKNFDAPLAPFLLRQVDIGTCTRHWTPRLRPQIVQTVSEAPGVPTPAQPLLSFGHGEPQKGFPHSCAHSWQHGSWDPTCGSAGRNGPGTGERTISQHMPHWAQWKRWQWRWQAHFGWQRIAVQTQWHPITKLRPENRVVNHVKGQWTCCPQNATFFFGW